MIIAFVLTTPDEAGKLPSDLEAISGSGLITDISTMSLSEALDSRGELEVIAVAEYCKHVLFL